MAENWMNRIELAADEFAKQEGCFLYDVEFVGQGSQKVLRVFIDKESGPGIDDCSNVSRNLNEFLDKEDLVPEENYHLEVSTPGLERNLKKDWHFSKVIGKKVKLQIPKKLEEYGVEGKQWKLAKQFECIIENFSEGVLQLVIDQQNHLQMPISDIQKAQLVFEVKGPQQKKKF